jgi:Mor family transcriptional regulator
VSANFERVASFMRDLGDTVAREVKRELNLSEARAVEIGMACAQKACEEYGGQLIYVPLGLALQISARDRELYAFYTDNGRDIVATAKQFNCSVQTAYKRVRMVETAAYNDRQGALFEDPE